ncbi:MAG: hypothetical protein J1F01_07925 [Oscillospiraceae bacterium]|nr:hypothetical protein [Oscillospiraceae bacterium]
MQRLLFYAAYCSFSAKTPLTPANGLQARRFNADLLAITFLRAYLVFYILCINLTVARAAAPPLSQKATFTSPVRLQARSQRLWFTIAFLRVHTPHTAPFPQKAPLTPANGLQARRFDADLFATTFLRAYLVFYILYINLTVTRAAAPPLSQKATFTSPVLLQARSQRLWFTIAFLRVHTPHTAPFP